MFVGILLRDFARDFGIEFESSRHREIFEISSRAVKKLQGASLKVNTLKIKLTWKAKSFGWFANLVPRTFKGSGNEVAGLLAVALRHL